MRRRNSLANDGEKVLGEMLRLKVKTVRKDKIFDHDSGEFVNVETVETNPALVKIKQDSAKFVVERLVPDYQKKEQLNVNHSLTPTPFEPDQVAKLQSMIAESDIIEGDIVATDSE